MHVSVEISVASGYRTPRVRPEIAFHVRAHAAREQISTCELRWRGREGGREGRGAWEAHANARRRHGRLHPFPLLILVQKRSFCGSARNLNA